VIGRAQRRLLAGILGLGLAAWGPIRAGAESGEAANLRLVVRHALEAGRLIVRVGETAFFSAPLAPAGADRAGSLERLLSIPAGMQTVIVELRDPRGKVTARGEVRGLLVRGAAGVLAVAAPAGGDRLSLELKAAP
jgi:hypothetical protein